MDKHGRRFGRNLRVGSVTSCTSAVDRLYPLDGHILVFKPIKLGMSCLNTVASMDKHGRRFGRNLRVGSVTSCTSAVDRLYPLDGHVLVFNPIELGMSCLNTVASMDTHGRRFGRNLRVGSTADRLYPLDGHVSVFEPIELVLSCLR